MFRNSARLVKNSEVLKTPLLLTLLVSFSCLLYGQAQDKKFVFNRVLAPDGSNFLHITGITQDRSGYLWLSSKKGFYRYDGYQMTSYKNDPLDANSLPANELEAICTDKDGNIWLGSLGAGVLKFDPVREKFTQYRHSQHDTSSLNADWISALMTDKDGNIWVGTGNGLDRLDSRTGKFVHYRSDKNDPRSLSSNAVVSIYQDRQGTIWVGTGSIYGPEKSIPSLGGLNRMDDISGKFTRYVHDPNDANSLINNKVRAIYESRDGTFWVGTAGDGLHTMDRKTGKFTRHTYDPANPEKLSRPPLIGNPYTMITFITEDRKRGIWIGTTDNGLSYYDPQLKKTFRVGPTGNSESEFNERDAWTAYSSAEGVLWIGTFMGSLYNINPMKLTMPFHDIDAWEVNGFYEDKDGTLWIGTAARGLLQFDANRKLLHQFVHNADNPKSLANDTILTLTADSYGNIWLGTLGGGLEQFTKNRNEFIHHSSEPGNDNSLSNDTVIFIFEDRNRDLWLGTFRGLNLWNRKKNTFRRYIFYPEDTLAFGKNIVSSVIQDRNNNYWVSSYADGGLHAQNPENGIFRTYLKGLSFARVFEDAEGKLWAGGIEGLFYYDPDKDDFVRYKDPLGLNQLLDIKSIVEDDEHNLWLSTSNAVVKINKARDLVTTYDNHFGIDHEMTYGVAHKGRSGKLFFGAMSGYYSFSPKEFNKESEPPKILISRFHLGNEDLLPDENGPLTSSIDRTEKIKLSHHQNVFSFDFAAIDFIDPKANRQLFMLENYDQSWNLAGFERRALYFNVPPGKYVFRVKAVNAYGKWSERRIDIEIVPAWWSRWWFRIAALLVTVMGIYFLIRWRLQEKFRLQMERADREKELSLLQHRTAQLEMHALRAQMNPHFLFNSLNSINRFIIQNNSEQASAYLTKFSRLMRLILQNSQNELVSLENEVEALKLYLELEAVRFDHHFTYKIKIDETLDIAALKIPPLIIQPYAENAIWHGLMHKEEKGHLLIELIEDGEFLICRITDDGIGRQKAAELKSKSASTHKSMGMKITADRISTMKQKKSNQNHIKITDLVLADGIPAGTSVEIKISLQYD